MCTLCSTAWARKRKSLLSKIIFEDFDRFESCALDAFRGVSCSLSCCIPHPSPPPRASKQRSTLWKSKLASIQIRHRSLRTGDKALQDFGVKLTSPENGELKGEGRGIGESNLEPAGGRERGGDFYLWLETELRSLSQGLVQLCKKIRWDLKLIWQIFLRHTRSLQRAPEDILCVCQVAVSWDFPLVSIGKQVAKHDQETKLKVKSYLGIKHNLTELELNYSTRAFVCSRDCC